MGPLQDRLGGDRRVVAAAGSLADEWAARTPPGGGNRDWESYRSGGVEALRDLS